MKRNHILLVTFCAALLLQSSHVAAMPYTVLLESEPGVFPSTELFHLRYDSFQDVIDNQLSGSGFGDYDPGDEYSVAGIAHDGSYRVLLESEPGVFPSTQVFHLSYDSFEDYVNHQPSSFGFSDYDPGDTYSIAGFAYDGAYQVILESEPGAFASTEVFYLTFDTFDDLLTNQPSAFGFSDYSPGDTYSIAGVSYDGLYRVLLESEPGAFAGTQVFQLTFDSFADFIDNNPSDFGFSDIDPGDTYSIAAFVSEVNDSSRIPLPSPLGLLAAGAIAALARQKRAEG